MAEVLIVCALGLTHLAAPWLLRLTDRVVPDPVPVAHGLAVGYVFLHLMPEIGDGLADRDLAVGWLLLLGFLAFSAAEAGERVSRRPGVRLALQVGMAATASWLIGSSIPEAANHRPMDAVVVFLAAALHLLEGHHRGVEGGPLPAPLRAVLAASVVAGVVADELWAETVEALDHALVALVAGGILTTGCCASSRARP